MTRRLPDIEARIKLLEQKGPRGEQPAPPAEATLADLRTRVDALAAAIAIDAKGQKTQNAEVSWTAVQNSMGWRLLNVWRKGRDQVAPKGSYLRKLYDGLIHHWAAR